MARHWVETSDDGAVLRRIEFDSAAANPVPEHLWAGDEDGVGCARAAASAMEIASVRERFGDVGVWCYEAVRGALGDPVPEPTSIEEVRAAEFEDAWDTAVRHRSFVPCVDGPLPEGASIAGTVEALPWGRGKTGVYVDLGMPIPGFVDVANLPPAPEDWPGIGMMATFEVVRVRVHRVGESTGLQIGLRPIGAYRTR